MRQIFEIIDKDGSNTIEIKELVDLFEKCGIE